MNVPHLYICEGLHCIVSVCITASTRKVYEKKLQQLLEQPPLESSLPEPETTIPEALTIKAGGNQNGNTHSAEEQYSDKEEGKTGMISTETSFLHLHF